MHTVQCSFNNYYGCTLTMWRVHSQIDGYVGNAFIGSCYPIRLRFDLLTDLIEICELLALAV